MVPLYFQPHYFEKQVFGSEQWKMKQKGPQTHIYKYLDYTDI